MRGVLHAVGVGSGDPDLLTIRAVQLVKEADLLSYPVNECGISWARSIVSDFIPAAIEEYAFPLPIRQDSDLARAVYDRVAQRLESAASLGRKVVILCLGDPFFYGSFAHIFARLTDKSRVEVTPGISSLSAAAALFGTPLAMRNDLFKIVPATLDEESLRQAFKTTGPFAILKIGRHLGKIRRLLKERRLDGVARVLKSVAPREQQLVRLRDLSGEEETYFSLILVPGEREL